jgi:hypothetical protein
MHTISLCGIRNIVFEDVGYMPSYYIVHPHVFIIYKLCNI